MAKGTERKRVTETNATAKLPGRRTIAGWRANAHEVEFTAQDLDLLDNVITVVPLLRIVAAIGKEARRRGVTYPIADVGQLQTYLRNEILVFGHHQIDRESVARVLPESWFPIAHEGEFLSRVHLALVRCEFEAAQLRPRPAFLPR